MAYKIVLAETVTTHLQWLSAAERKRVLDGIQRQLTGEPLLETRNRKPLRPNPIAPWELRLGTLRVFYEVVSQEPGTVHVLAVGKKLRNALRIGGQEIKL